MTHRSSIIEENPSSPPNVVLINADDLGWTDFSFMGSSYYETPHIDRLAKQGCIYTQAYASAANCAPSRANMLTGRYPSAHGIYTVGDSQRGKEEVRKLIPIENQTNLPSSLPTLASELKKLGYRTGIVGKWHISNDPKEHGFDENIAGCHMGGPTSYFAPYHIPTLAEGQPGEYLPERLISEAIDFIKRNKDQAFFLYYPTYLVHTPLQAPEAIIAKYKAKKHSSDHNNPIYAAMVEALDNCVGRLLDSIQDMGLSNKTLVIFTSDNGGIRAISKQTPLRAGKGSYYEGGIRVPMIATWPAQIPSGTTCHVPISNIDFFPSLLKLCGGNLDQITLDGDDMSACFTAPQTARDTARAMLWHFPIYLEAYKEQLDGGRDPLFRTRPGTVLRAGEWKLHRYYEYEEEELYHLPSDLGEIHPCQDQHPEILKTMKSAMNTMLRKYKLPVPTVQNPNFSQEENDKNIESISFEPEKSLISEKSWIEAMAFID